MNMDSYAVCSVDDLLDLPSDEFFSATANPNTNAATGSLLGSPSPSAAGTFLAPGCSSDVTDFICVPNDDAAELEWLSNYMDDSITDLPADELTAAVNFHSSGFVAGFHGRARSKRSRPTATENPMASGGGGVAMKAENLAVARRRCTHCASEKTPQWRTGPLGPKTLCNACGVRYKSGRLVPEYRPAASPTFMLTQHSNSHRKVLELRRQKDLLRHQYQSLRQPNSDSEGYSCHSGIC